MKILLVTEFIAPVNAVASIRWTKLGKYLVKNHGVSVDVLTNEKNFSRKKLLSENHLEDPTLRDDAAFFKEVFVIEDGIKLKIIHGIYNTLRFIKKNLMGLKRKLDLIVLQAPNEGSFPERSNPRSSLRESLMRLKYDSICKRYNLVTIDYSQYDIVVSSYGPRWTHRIASRIKKEHSTLIWIADYRDAPVYSNTTDTEENRSFAKRVTGGADCVVAVSQGGADLLFLDSTQRLEIVTNGYDPDDMFLKKSKDPLGKFELTYTGTLYDEGDGLSDLTPLLRALEELIERGNIQQDDVVVRYAGSTEDVFLRQTRSFPTVPVCSVGLVSRDKAIEMQSISSLLIFCIWNTELVKGGITGKLFEYLNSGVPIVGVCSGDSPGSVAKTIIENAGAGFCYEEAAGEREYRRLVEFVLHCYEQWRRCGTTFCNTNSEYVSQFSHPVLAAQMAGIMASLLADKENGQ